MTSVHEFRIDIPEADLDDLQRRLDATRFIPAAPSAGWEAGVPPAFLRQLLDHWRHRFDWRALEAKLNGMRNLRVEVTGTTMHCVVIKGVEAQSPPIVLVHGWPSSFVELIELGQALADPQLRPDGSRRSFDVVIPSLPGFGFSPTPSVTPWSAAEDGRAIVELMEALGYERFAVHTHDIGSSIMSTVLVEMPERIIAYHTTEPGIPGPIPRPDPAEMSDVERQRVAFGEEWHAQEGGYFALLGTRPQTLAHALNDSPAGLAAWIVEKWWSWTVPPGSGRALTDFMSFDQVLANIAVYWHTHTIHSANWPYFRSGTRERLPGEHTDIPVGVALTTQPIDRVPRSWASRYFRHILHWRDLEAGGHFVAGEHPSAVAASIVDFFDLLPAGREG